MAALIDRRAFSDFHGLAKLASGVIPDMAETRRRIFVSERRSDVRRPDHFYKGYLEDRLRKVGTVGELPRIVLERLAERYLERRDGRVAVHYDRFGEWHELLPYISPLAVIVAFLSEEVGGRDPRDLREFYARNLGATSLIGSNDLALDDLVERKGLNELHMHLNGSTELDVLWPRAVMRPDEQYREFQAAWTNHHEASAELYEQIESGLTPQIVHRRLRAARRVRRLVAEKILADRAGGGDRLDIDALLTVMTVDRTDADCILIGGTPLRHHPTDVLYARPGSDPLIKEALWLHACLDALRRDPFDQVVGVGLYFNLLVSSQFARLSVQQVDEAGFDQFQKYTLAGAREDAERDYESRFRQLNGRGVAPFLAHLEGRFAPKGTLAGTRQLVSTIVDGYLTFRGCRHRRGARDLVGHPPPCFTESGCDATSLQRCGNDEARARMDTEFVLVAHFIKRRPSFERDGWSRCQDGDLRLSVREQSRILGRMVSENLIARSLICGIDAAANELHAGPEPFAAAFRSVRRAGIHGATFHVGEDFRHLLSGIRAVAEAMAFLGLRAGDRLGHATALGIAPKLWIARAAPRFMLQRSDRLDDAVYAHRILSGLGGFERDVVTLERVIAEDCEAVYDAEFSPALLHRAWELRTLDALEMREVEREQSTARGPITAQRLAERARMMARTVLDIDRSAELTLIAERLEGAGAAYGVFARRHVLRAAKREAVVETEANIVSREALEAMQEETLRSICRSGVAIETLPTSNMRISYYEGMAEHHLFRWLGLAGPPLRNRPVVVIGSDDPGIFATNIRNEYAAVGEVLRTRFGKSAMEAAAILETLNDAGRIRRFRSPTPVVAGRH